MHPGQSTLIFYTAHNTSDKAITGVSTYNVAPQQAGYYFNKIQCFCFEEQKLRPGMQSSVAWQGSASKSPVIRCCTQVWQSSNGCMHPWCILGLICICRAYLQHAMSQAGKCRAVLHDHTGHEVQRCCSATTDKLLGAVQGRR